jgi:hypothetical protein
MILVWLLVGFFTLVCCTPPDGNGDAGTPDTPSKAECVTPRDCSKTQDCVKGKCVAAKKCEKFLDCKVSQVCFEGRCVDKCELDTDCPTNYVCVSGVCHEPDWKSADPPNKNQTERKPLKAGVGVVELDFPLSVSTAGYGFRFGPKGPYAKVLGASTGVWDRFYVKAVALDDGVKRLFMVRSSMCFMPDYLRTQIVQYVIKNANIDVSKGLFLNANHTHSGPGRFWNLLPGKGMGSLGYGSFLPEVFMRLVKSFGDAIIAANKNLKPAKFGYKVDPNFDPDGKIFGDRRGANPSYRNPHLVVMRIDSMDDKPMAVLVNFGMHGIVAPFQDFHLTADAGGGVEMILQQRLEKKYKTRIETMFMQGSAGDISPRGGHMGHGATQKMQMLGHLTSLTVEKMLDSIKTSSDIKIDFVHKRIGLSRELVGYKKDEFFKKQGNEKIPYRYGAFRCVQKAYNYSKEPDKKHKDGLFQCQFDVTTLNDGAPIPQFSKTHLSAARIGGLFIGTFPGESSSFLAKRLRETLVKESGGKIKDVATFGYTQDHQFYILGKDDWLRGGYEASMHIWGYLFGEYLLKELTKLTLQLVSDKPRDNKTRFLPQDFYGMQMKVTIPREQTPDAGKMIKQPPKTYERLGNPMSFTVSGGWIGVDNPRVVLQKKEGNDFKDVKTPGGRVLSDDGHQIVMDFTQEKKAWHYTFHFEALQDFPTGVYRFRIRGYKWEGDKKEAYETNTEEFEVKASTRLWLRTVKLTKNELQASIGYPPSTSDNGKDPFEKLERKGQLMRSSQVRWEMWKPIADPTKVTLTVKLEKDGKLVEEWKQTELNWTAKTSVQVVTFRGKDGKENKQSHKDMPVTGFKLKPKQPLAAGTYKLFVEFEDHLGNKGKWTQDLTLK